MHYVKFIQSEDHEKLEFLPILLFSHNDSKSNFSKIDITETKRPIK